MTTKTKKSPRLSKSDAERKEARVRIVAALAEFLTADAAAMSLALGLPVNEPSPLTATAHRWAALRRELNIAGYPRAEAVETHLHKWFEEAFGSKKSAS